MTRRAPRTLSTITEAQTTRRQLLAMATVGSVGVAGVAAAGPAQAAASDKAKPGKHEYTLTVLGTTDLHGNVYNWDYYKNAEYDDSGHRDIGVAKAATLIKMVREEVGAGNDHHPGRRRHHPGHAARVLLRQDRAHHRRNHAPHGPGHELRRLRRRRSRQPRVQLRPGPAAHLRRPVRPPAAQRQHRRLEHRRPALPALRHQDGQGPRPEAAPRRHPRTGHARRRHLGQGERPGQGEVPGHRRAGQDLRPAPQGRRRRCRRRVLPLRPTHVVVLRRRPAVPRERQPPARRAGRGHRRHPRRARPHRLQPAHHQYHDGQEGSPGRAALLGYAGRPHGHPDGQGQGASGSSTTPRSPAGSTTPTPCPRMPRSPGSSGRRTRRCSPTSTASIGTSKQAMSAATSRYEDTAAMDFINYVQGDAVRKALAGTADATTPMLSIAAPFNKAAAIPAGDVTVRDVAGLYIYDNTLLGIKFTGAQVLAYLEYSARYFKIVGEHWPVPGRRGHQRRHRHGTERHPRLQLRHHGRARRAADVRHRHRPAGRQPDQEPPVCGCSGDGEPGVHHRHQQLPPVRRRQLPRA